ncbi:uncharacterized protein LOC129607715 [Condylostylus longicornis]|uniref:uncharacterized protein LOC129607715 n=1 Tax=Condylostylus longicornis TaxID=2530218 RepID=UPI00244E2793|nr:uncharacterized protein LOC129607715 [Condylostylus longicornis]
MNESSEKRSKCTLTEPVEIVTLPVLSEMYMMKPWLNNDNIDEKKSFSILSKINLLNFFKCMMCTFSTNWADQMQNHFKSHKSINLECCYCNVVLNRPPDLIKHMKIYHASCNFQCSSCFYRSYSAFHVKIHIKKYHKKTSKIIVCDGPELSMNALFKVIIESRERYLKPYTCHLCNEGKCYLQEDLRDHFKRNHYNSVFCNCDYHGLFCCFFCHFETDSIELIEIHMADIHAEKGLFVGARLRNQKLEKHKKSIQLYDKFKMNSTVIIDLSNILHEDQFLESKFLKQKMKRISENMEDFKKIAENANETVWSSDDYTSKYLIKYSSSSKENLDRFTRNNSLEKLEKNFQKLTKLIVSSLNDKDLKHPYFCYLCGICTTSLSKLENHFSIEHKILQIKSEKLEQYFIGIPNEINYNRLTLLIHIVNVLDLKKHDIKNKNKSKSNSNKKLLQLPKFIPLEKGRYKCFEKNCPYGTQSESLFFESHLKLIHRSIKRFECIHCNFKIDKVTCDFNDIKNHLRMHSEILYTCTICFFYNHQRQIVQKHVRLMHKVEMNITNVIRSQKHDIEEYSFTTCLKENEKILKQHFCLICGIDTIKPKNFIKHLDKDHSIIIMYECQYCNNLYNVLDKIIEHSNKDHKKPLKIRCEYEYKKNIDHTNENFNESIDEHSSKSKTSKKYSRKEKK